MEETSYRRKFQGIFIIWNLDVLLADCLGAPFDALIREGFNKNSIGIKSVTKWTCRQSILKTMSWFSFLFKVQCNISCLSILFLSFSKIQNNLKKLLEDGEWNINVLGLLQTSFFCLDKPFQRSSAGQSSSFFIFSPSQVLTTVKLMSSCKKVSWFFSMYLYILKTYGLIYMYLCFKNVGIFLSLLCVN